MTGGPEPHVVEDAGVRVVGAHIAQVGPIGTLAAAYADETLWPAGGRLLLPGYVNAHAHLARHLARGLALAGPADWERYDRALAPEDVQWAALAALVEGVRHGITTTCDLHRSGSCLDLSLSEVTSAARKLGVRVATAYAAAEEDDPATRRAALEESASLARELKRRREGRLRGLVGLRARTAEGLAALVHASRDACGDEVALHVELAPGAMPDERWPGLEPAAGRPSLWAHLDVAPRDLVRRLGGDGAIAVAGPGAARAGSGGYAELAWGSDAAVNAPPVAVATAGGMLERAAAEAHYRRVFANGAAWASRCFGEGLGVIEPGAPADLILVDYRPATEMSGPALAAHLATGVARAPVSGAMVAGEIVMDHGALVTVDEAEVAARARECARRVWKRL
jgi:cytosine/adenosine deaminase-related metal-dependent hydrolase